MPSPATVSRLSKRLSKLLLRSRSGQREERQLLIEHDGQRFVVRYRLARTRRRTIGFQIDGRGLSIASPYWVTNGEIESAIREKSAWILAKQEEWRSYEEARREAAPRYEQGGHIQFLGERLRLDLVLTSRVRGVDIELGPGVLTLRGAQVEDPAWVERKITDWLKAHARSLYGNRLAIYTARAGLGPTSWGLSSARTRWGSCNSEGRILLSWRLMHFPLHIIDYVIAHEVAHLEEMNHSPRFWAVVERLLPDYRTARAELKRYPDGLAP